MIALADPARPGPGAGILLARPTHARLLGLAAGLGLVVLQAALTLTHIPWEDEAQAWMLAVWSPSWADLVSNLSYEGHPALWYGLMRLVSAASTSPYAMSGLKAAVSVAALVLLLVRAPFPLAHRLALGASYLLLFEYGTIARSYGLGVLLLFGFLSLRPRLAAWLCLALMANVSVHFLVLSAGCIAAHLLVERRWSWGGFALWLGGVAVAIATIWPAPDIVPALVLPASWTLRFKLFLASFDGLLLPMDEIRFPLPRKAEPALTGGLLGPVVLAGLWLALRQDRRLLAIAGALFLACAGIALVLYPTSIRHVGILILFLIAADWIRAETAGAPPHIVSRSWAALSAVLGLAMAASAMAAPFTAVRGVVAWARAAGYADAVWTTYPVPMLPMLAAELGRPVYDLDQSCNARFVRWNRLHVPLESTRELVGRVKGLASGSGGLALLLTGPEAAPAEGPGIVRVKDFPAGLEGGPKIVFAIRADAAAPLAIATCPWTR